MKKLKKTIFGFCVFLLVLFTLFIPFKAEMGELDSRFGVNAFVLNRYGWEEWDKPLKMLKELKIGWTREEFVWKQIEPTKGKFNWDFYDKAFEQLSDENVNILGILDYSAPWATENPYQNDADKYMPNVENWKNFVDKVVERYGRQVKYWQIWNEENIPTFFKPEPNVDNYLTLLKAAYETIKARDKNAKVVLGGTSGVDVGYLRRLKEAGGDKYFDILAVHPYRLDFKTPPEKNGFMKDLKLADDIAKEFGNKPIWLTEFGWPTDKKEGVDEDTQANYLVRSYVMSFSFPNIKKLFWYDFRNDGEDEMWREYNFGLVKRDYIGKKSFYAYKNLIDQLEHSDFEGIKVNGEGGVYDFVFSRGGDEIRVIWKVDGEGAVSVGELPVVQTYNIVGEEQIFRSRGGPVVIPISPSPRFVVIKGKRQEVREPNNYNYQYVEQSPYLSLKNGDEEELWLKIKNTGSVTWKNSGEYPLLLGTCRGRDRESSFFVQDSWIGSNRPAKLNEGEVKPGEIGTFGFKIKLEAIKPGKYREYFCPVVENVSWLRDGGIYWDIEIKEASENNESSSVEKKEDYDYEYLDQSSHLILPKGSVATLWIKLKNTGSKNWEKKKFNLGTSRKKDRKSLFNNNWISYNRIGLDQDTVGPGEVGTFTFQIKAPQARGVYKEYFQPVVEGVSWLRDMGIYWQITVR